MANVGPKAWYLRDSATVGYTNVPVWTANTVTAAGVLRRPTAAAVGSERVVVAIIAGTTAATQPTWTTTKGARNTDNTVTWQEVTGQPAVNGELPVSVTTNASTASGNPVLHLASVPATVRVGMLAMHASLPTGATTATVVSISATSVVLSGNATALIASGQTVFFSNGPMWLAERNTVLTIGLVIYDSVTASLQIVSVAGTTGNAAQPSFSATAGTNTGDNTVTWTSLGPASSFGIWAAPHAKIQNVYTATWGGIGDDCFAADDHNQTQATTINISFPGASSGTVSNNIWCIDHTASLPSTSAALRSDPYTVTNPACAQITTTASGGITFTGAVNIYGVVLNCGTGVVNASINAGVTGRLERCSLRKLGTSATTGAIFLNNGEFVGSTVQVGNVGDAIRANVGSLTRWSSTPLGGVIGPTLPTVLIGPATSQNLTLDGVNLSALGAGRTLVSSLTIVQSVRLIGIIVGSGVTIAAVPTSVGARVEATWVDSAAGTVQEGVWTVQGTLSQEATVVRTGPSWRIIPTINNRWTMPFMCPDAALYNAVVGSPITCTVYGTWLGTTLPSNDDVWIEVRYFGDASSPMTTTVSSTKADNFAQGTPVASDASVWGGGVTPFKVAVTLTPQQAGPIRVTVCIATTSTTMYIDPAPVLS